MNKWLAAGIVEIHTDNDPVTGEEVQIAVKVHFVGFKPKWDEVIDLRDQE